MGLPISNTTTVLAFALLSGCAASPPNTAPADEWIAFSSGRSGEGDLYALSLTRDTTVFVAGSPAPEGAPRYDAARDRVAYQRYEASRTVTVVGDAVLFETRSDEHVPAWSPDGALIAYVDTRGGRDDLFVAQVDGSGERRLTDDDATDRYPAWSPDSKRLVFARLLDSGWDLHAINVDEGAASLERLTRRGVYVGHPSWAPDGRSIAFDTSFGDEVEIAVLDVETGTVTRMTERAGNDLVPAWSADGHRIAFGGETDGEWDLWLVDVETRALRQLTTAPGFDGGPVFVPASALVQ